MTFLKRLGLMTLVGVMLASAGWHFLPAQAGGATFYVATNGNNGNDGLTAETAWATINHAIQNVPDGSTILVLPGTYNGDVAIVGEFTTGVIVRSSEPYQAKLRHDGTGDRSVMRVWYATGVTIEGFDIAHAAGNTYPLVIQVQDLLGDVAGIGDGSDPVVSNITFRNNIIHSSTNNDVLKINNGARDITVEGNLFFNQSGSDEHMDVNSVVNVVIQDNVFFNDFATNSDTSSFIVIKDSNGNDDGILGAENITVQRNVFLNWQGSDGNGFLLVGEDGHPYYEAREVLIQNNLFLGNSGNMIRAPFGVKGGEEITFRHNTVVGDLPGRAFAMRLNQEGDNPVNQNIFFYNNIWSDPMGTMGSEASTGVDFAEVDPAQNSNVLLDHNLYWNSENPIPADTGPLVTFESDANRLVADPLLGNQLALVVPSWNGTTFADGSTTIREVFERLVENYGRPGNNSMVVGAANSAQAPADDILGNTRDEMPDIGAVEKQGPVAVDDFYLMGSNSSITITAPGVQGNDLGISENAQSFPVDVPSNGSYQLNEDGSFTYTPNLDFVGTDSFSYHLTDNAVTSNTATVTFQVSSGFSRIYLPLILR